jgi:hypothetical protein
VCIGQQTDREQFRNDSDSFSEFSQDSDIDIDEHIDHDPKMSGPYWTETSVWFDDVGISAFHSCVVVNLWQSLSEWHLLLSECVLVCCHENVGA